MSMRLIGRAVFILVFSTQSVFCQELVTLGQKIKSCVLSPIYLIVDARQSGQISPEEIVSSFVSKKSFRARRKILDLTRDYATPQSKVIIEGLIEALKGHKTRTLADQKSPDHVMQLLVDICIREENVEIRRALVK